MKKILLSIAMIFGLSVSANAEWITPTEDVCTSIAGKFDKSGCYANWTRANDICQASGARLPTIDELKKVITDCGGVVDDSKNVKNLKYQKCYQKNGFASELYWSSIFIKTPVKARGVEFYGGHQLITSYAYTRCIK